VGPPGPAQGTPGSALGHQDLSRGPRERQQRPVPGLGPPETGSHPGNETIFPDRIFTLQPWIFTGVWASERPSRRPLGALPAGGPLRGPSPCKSPGLEGESPARKEDPGWLPRVARGRGRVSGTDPGIPPSLKLGLGHNDPDATTTQIVVGLPRVARRNLPVPAVPGACRGDPVNGHQSPVSGNPRPAASPETKHNPSRPDLDPPTLDFFRGWGRSEVPTPSKIHGWRVKVGLGTIGHDLSQLLLAKTQCRLRVRYQAKLPSRTPAPNTVAASELLQGEPATPAYGD
jgi:hypothetical protein